MAVSKLKSEDIDYIYIDTRELTFRIVMNDDTGEDVVVDADNIDLSHLAIDDLCDDVKRHIEDGKPLKIVREPSIITFEADTNLKE
tara:strand:- start:1283 stop:1540 length:258 start_codon:yes stop_codon:yes gene_type:complete